MNIRVILIFSLFIVLLIIIMRKYKISRIQHGSGDKTYYFDNNATTHVYDKAIEQAILTWVNCGNPSNVLHIEGLKAKEKLDECRKMIADDLMVNPSEIYFTSGATEANNLALRGTIDHQLEKFPKERFTIITSNFEHPSVTNIFKHYENLPNSPIDVVYVKIRTQPNDNYYGSINPMDVEKVIREAKTKVLVLSIMYANNETGAVQNITEIGKIAKKHGVYFHSDVTQAIGKFIIHPTELNLDAISFSAHKFHGPKGMGCLYLRKQCDDISNLCYGGEQEASKRPGTENIAFIVAMAMALKNAHTDLPAKVKNLLDMRNYIKNELSKLDVICIEPKHGVLPNTLLVILKDIDVCNKSFAKELSDTKNICVGISSACQTSHNSLVLEAMRVPEINQNKVMRISMSTLNTPDECKYLVESVKELLAKHRGKK